VLAIESLDKSYRGPDGKVQALQGVSLSVAGGDFVAVQGASGCGKTTLLLAAGGLLAPDTGRITVEGRDIYAMSAAERARWRATTVGFVFQQFHLIPYLSVRDNILAASLGLSGPANRARAEELAGRFGLRERLRHVPAALSTGERQRTALARALLNQPRLLLADEPTGNLDEDSARAVLDGLREFAASGGAVLLVTHDARAAACAARRLRFDGKRLGAVE
jgi:ABC-type lipoprotein export system ATPase subunit